MSIIEDERTWHISKEIPVALIVSIAGSLFLGGVAYQSLRSEQVAQGKQQSEIVARLDKADIKIDRLHEFIQSSSVPSALNARRMEDLERITASLQSTISQHQANTLQLTARVAETERRLATESMKMRAARER